MNIVTSDKLFDNKSFILDSIYSFNAIVTTKLTDTFRRLDKVIITVIAVKNTERSSIIVKKLDTFEYLYAIITKSELDSAFINLEESEFGRILY